MSHFFYKVTFQLAVGRSSVARTCNRTESRCHTPQSWVLETSFQGIVQGRLNLSCAHALQSQVPLAFGIAACTEALRLDFLVFDVPLRFGVALTIACLVSRYSVVSCSFESLLRVDAG